MQKIEKVLVRQEFVCGGVIGEDLRVAFMSIGRAV